MLLAASAAGTSLAAWGLAGCSPSTPQVFEKVVEVTRIVEKTVEVTRIVEKTVEATQAMEKSEATRENPSPIDLSKIQGKPVTITPTSSPRDSKSDSGLIWYVDIEHEKVLQDPQQAPGHFRVRDERTRVLGDIAGVPSEYIRYTEVSESLAKERGVAAIAISGNVTDWEEYDFKEFQPLFDVIRSGRFPVIGLCGGHQLVGIAYNANLGPIRRLKPGEADRGGFALGWFKEVGYLPVYVVKQDPIFAGLGDYLVVFESHYWEIKELPAEFELLASTDDCRVQVMRHKEHRIYGTQFHPEVHTPTQPDGRLLLANFFRLAGILPPL